jgi:hypothetical protein
MKLVSSEISVGYVVQHRLPDRIGNDFKYSWRGTSKSDTLEEAYLELKKSEHRYPTLEGRILKVTTEILIEQTEE